jgi:hypothetical protein
MDSDVIIEADTLSVAVAVRAIMGMPMKAQREKYKLRETGNGAITVRKGGTTPQDQCDVTIRT